MTLRNHLLRTRCSAELIEKIDKFIEEMTYPGSKDLTVQSKFKSRSDFFLYVIKAVLKCNKTEWEIFANWLNPYRRF